VLICASNQAGAIKIARHPFAFTVGIPNALKQPMGILKRIIQIVRAETASFQQGARPASRKNADFHTTDLRHPEGPEYPQQVIEDLAVFNLRPPSSMEEIKRVRNQEMKKYHADRFYNDPERYQTSQEIMQIYNTAYERLKNYYDKTAEPSR
jgi:hypothetical protein